MNKYYAASCSHLLGGSTGHWGQAARAVSSTWPQSHPKRHFPRVGCPRRAGQSSRRRRLLGPGVWTGGAGLGDLCWGFGQGFMSGLWAGVLAGALGFKLGLQPGSCCSRGTPEPGQGQPVLYVHNCEQTAKSLNLGGQLEIFLAGQGGVLASWHQMLLIFQVHF